MKPTVFITRPVQQQVVDRVAERCTVRVNSKDEPMDPHELADSIRETDGVIACLVRVSEQILATASRLKIVANIGSGYDNIDVEACTRRGVLVTNTPQIVGEATADLAFTLMLSAARRVIEADRYVRDAVWKYSQYNLLWGSEVYGKTLGLYGFGPIARAMARRGRGFLMQTIYYARHRADAAVEKDLGATFVAWDTLLRESDFLSVHVPLTDETYHAIAAPQFALMKRTSIFINTARGSIVDEEALAEALRSGQIRAAGLDVFEHEPRVHTALTALPNVVLAPHLGTATAETRLRMAFRAVDNLFAALDGRRPPDLLNPQALPSP
jgi:glyoxylate reductase